MPEGDSIHRAARRLQVLVGEPVDVETPNPRAAVKQLAERLDGRVLESVGAVGKHLLLRFEGGISLRSHLRMTGRWQVVPRGRTTSRAPWLLLRGREWEAVQWNGPVLSLDVAPVARLGPDVLGGELDADAVVARLRAGDPGRRLGEALLDQRVVAGIGNMWLAEAAWQARVSPWLRVRDAPDEELGAVVLEVRRLMQASLAGHRSSRSVYRRAGRPCPRCGEAIRARGLGDDNRTAYWCPACQRGDGPPSA